MSLEGEEPAAPIQRKLSLGMKAYYWGQYVVPRLAVALTVGMGDSLLRGIARGGGRLACALDAPHRQRAITNLEAAGYSPREAKKIALGMFQHFMSTFIEGLVLRRRIRVDNYAKYVHLVNRPVLDEAVAAGKGVIFVGCHQGSWELAGVVMSLLGYPLTTIARPFNNPYLDDYLNGALRATSGQRIVHKGGALRPLMRDVKAGRVGVILGDQNAGRGGMFVPFFGRPASTWATPALLALRTGARLLPFYTYRDGPYRYGFGVHEDPQPQRTGSLDHDLRAITKWYTALFERSIRQRPDQWLWAHRRWRNWERYKPEEEESATQPPV